MWGRKHDFKPDRVGSGFLNKLYLTQRQRLLLLKWVLYALVLVFLSLIQDVILCRVSIFGTTTDLLSGSILLLCILLGTESCAVFAVISTTLYYFSGSAAGPYCIFFLTGLGILLNIFRYSYLRKGFASTFLCLAAGLLAYQMLLFFTGLFLGYLSWERLQIFPVTAGITLAVMPLMYPVFASIGKIGGESWKE